MRSDDSVRPGAVVTGGASGIGLAVARRLAATGHEVLVLDADTDAIAAASGGPPEDSAAPGTVSFREVDVRDSRRVRAVVDEAMSGMTRPHLLCACAGIKPPVDIATLDEAGWDVVFDVNVRGAFFAVQGALPHLSATGGSVVLLGSASAHGDHENPLYGASKAAVIGLARSLAAAAVDTGVRVNVVVPGFTRTGMTRGMSPERLAAAARRGVGGRVNEPEDVAAAIAWLAGEEAATVSGAVLHVGTAAGIPARFGPLASAVGESPDAYSA
ncbi:MAG: short-chain dehydrogenase [Frankiales bacterium]|nr:short-chain dehydrogenase [Frankiales bacterium]